MKLLENFGNSSKVFSRCFMIYLKSSENLRKSLEVFGNLRKFSENFGNGSKVIFRCFYDFLKFSEIFGSVWKSSEKFPDAIGNVRNGSQELKRFGVGF